MSNEQLDPCPFCGNKAKIERYGNGKHSTIYTCTYCGCRLETGEERDHGKRWNHRVKLNVQVTDKRCATCDWWQREQHLQYGVVYGSCGAPVPNSIEPNFERRWTHESEGADCVGYKPKGVAEAECNNTG